MCLPETGVRRTETTGLENGISGGETHGKADVGRWSRAPARICGWRQERCRFDAVSVPDLTLFPGAPRCVASVYSRTWRHHSRNAPAIRSLTLWETC